MLEDLYRVRYSCSRYLEKPTISAMFDLGWFPGWST